MRGVDFPVWHQASISCIVIDSDTYPPHSPPCCTNLTVQSEAIKKYGPTSLTPGLYTQANYPTIWNNFSAKTLSTRLFVDYITSVFWMFAWWSMLSVWDVVILKDLGRFGIRIVVNVFGLKAGIIEYEVRIVSWFVVEDYMFFFTSTADSLTLPNLYAAVLDCFII